MSSAYSLSIEFDCRPPRAVPTATVLTVGAATSLSLLVGSDPWTFVAVLASGAVALAVCVRSGWLGGPRALRRALWTSEGKWWLVDGRGSVLPATLLADSRVFARWLWLRWDSAKGRRQAFLPRRSAQSEAVRRLAVRLRMEGLAHPDDRLL